MPKKYTQEELIALGQKKVAQMERDSVRTQARNTAVSKLIAAHEAEFKTAYNAALKSLGL